MTFKPEPLTDEEARKVAALLNSGDMQLLIRVVLAKRDSAAISVAELVTKDLKRTPIREADVVVAVEKKDRYETFISVIKELLSTRNGFQIGGIEPTSFSEIKP